MQKIHFFAKEYLFLQRTHCFAKKVVLPKTKEMPEFGEIGKIWVTGENLGKSRRKGGK